MAIHFNPNHGFLPRENSNLSKRVELIAEEERLVRTLPCEIYHLLVRNHLSELGLPIAPEFRSECMEYCRLVKLECKMAEFGHWIYHMT